MSNLKEWLSTLWHIYLMKYYIDTKAYLCIFDGLNKMLILTKTRYKILYSELSQLYKNG